MRFADTGDQLVDSDALGSFDEIYLERGVQQQVRCYTRRMRVFLLIYARQICSKNAASWALEEIDPQQEHANEMQVRFHVPGFVASDWISIGPRITTQTHGKEPELSQSGAKHEQRCVELLPSRPLGSSDNSILQASATAVSLRLLVAPLLTRRADDDATSVVPVALVVLPVTQVNAL
jgi:hypothetical protein